MYSSGLDKQLKEYGKVKVNTSTAKLTTFRIGGKADFLIEVDEIDRLVALLNFLVAEGVNYFFLGGGSNILFPDDGIRGVVIRFRGAKINVEECALEAESGASLAAVSNVAIKNSLTGLEWFAGIPGTIGGAVRGNAGARYEFTGGEIKDTLTKVEVWRDGEVLELANQECAFGYRESVFKRNNDIVLRAWFNLAKGDAQKSLATIQEILNLRRGKHPGAPSAGSFFKNLVIEKWKNDTKDLPEIYVKRGKIPAFWLIAQVDIKGFTIGGAKVSEEHGNFLINFNNATQADVLAVVEEVKSRVYNKFGVELEEEVNVIK